jgi:hypothetical protein
MEITKSYHTTQLREALADPGNNSLKIAIHVTVAAYGAIVIDQARNNKSRSKTYVLPEARTSIELFAFGLLADDMAAAGFTLKTEPRRRTAIAPEKAND